MLKRIATHLNLIGLGTRPFVVEQPASAQRRSRVSSETQGDHLETTRASILGGFPPQSTSAIGFGSRPTSPRQYALLLQSVRGPIEARSVISRERGAHGWPESVPSMA